MSQLGKHRRVSYPNRVNNSSSSVDLLHSDVWRLCRVTSLFGFCYFLIFVDGFSRISQVYLLKDRTQVLDVIKKFINEIKNQFSTIVRVLCTDNVLEYTQNDVSRFCTSHDILHQITCPHIL